MSRTTNPQVAHARRIPKPLRHRRGVEPGGDAVALLDALRAGMHDAVVAAEVAAAHANGVAGAAGRAAGRVSEVSGVVEQLEASVAEISRSTHEAQTVVTQASAASAEAVELLQRLSDATGEIGSMVEFINSIAEQTDLLALNATIEAARAGESGRGFGVVASEVKELARATGEATGQITAIVERLRTEANAAMNGVRQIAGLVEEFEARHSSIASAVEEQATATVDITHSLADASTDMHAVASGIDTVAAQTYEATVAASVAKHAAADLATNLAVDLPAATHDADPLLRGLAAHSDWKARLVHAIEAGTVGVAVDEVRAPDRCEFGRWLHGTIDPVDRQAPEYGQVRELHARFHERAADILVLAQRADRQAAVAAIAPGSDYAVISAELANEIVTWRERRAG